MKRLLRRFSADREFDYRDPCIAGRWIQSACNNGESSSFAIIGISEAISDYCEASDWDGLEKFARELLAGLWINSFMSYSRKIWVKQTGSGGQSAEPLPYQILSNSVLAVLAAEKAERDEWDKEDGEEEEPVVEDPIVFKDYIGNAA